MDAGALPLPDPGIRCLTADEAAHIAGQDPDHHQRDLHDAIDRGEHPSWTVRVQIMPVAEAPGYRFNPFDLTKVWFHRDHPLIEIRRMTLDRNPDNFFADVEQAAFDPGNFVPGIGPLAGQDAPGAALRLRRRSPLPPGRQPHPLPVNRPHATHAANYGRDGAMRFDGNHGRAKNFEPDSSGGPAQTGRPLYAPIEVHGVAGSHAPEPHAEDDDFVQAGALYRLITEPEKTRLIASIAGNLAQVTRKDIIDRSIDHFRRADPDYGARLDHAVEALRAKR